MNPRAGSGRGGASQPSRKCRHAVTSLRRLDLRATALFGYDLLLGVAEACADARGMNGRPEAGVCESGT
jgi:hypothetical protein